MTDSTSLQVQQLIQKAYQALRQNKRAEGRFFANSANQLDPTLEEPYLILAALSAPPAAVEYLKKALEINPPSPRARKGMQWAVQKLRSIPKPASAVEPTQPVAVPGDTPTVPQVIASAAAVIPFAPAAAVPLGVPQPQPAPAPLKAVSKKPRRARPALILVSALTGILLLVLLAWAGWPFISPVFAYGGSASRPAALLVKPSLTPTATATATFTATPTNTFTPTVTQTFTPTVTNTPLPTNTPTATNTPQPTNTPVPTKQKAPTQPPQTGAVVVPGEIHGNENWVDVNLSKQMAYAYEGSTLIRTFLVSTGVAAHPTVTGQFHVYVKYRYALMTGPGYYLPNVPYTMYFYESYGLHGTYWHHNFGHPMSHGCVNLKTEDAQWLYENFVSIGTLVNVHY
jgi:lipoprotein-anchoring transpeptidase ErfK/SrfK